MSKSIHLVSITTSTGTFPADPGYVSFGVANNSLAYAMGPNDSTGHLVGTVEGSIGGSDKWVTLITLTSTNSTGMITSSSGTNLFDKARIVVTDNASTASFPVWLASGPPNYLWA